MLAQSEVVRYLLDRALISGAAIVDGDLKILEASRRNRNFKVISGVGPSYLVKQGIGPDKRATVAHESFVYQFLAKAPESAYFRPYLPRYFSYDADQGLLILELLNNGLDLREYHARRGHFPIVVAAALGRALSRLHNVPLPTTAQEAGSRFVNRIPWVLALHRPGLTLFGQSSHANIQLMRVIQNTVEFPHLLDDLRAGWRIDSLIHNDIKWDNCLVPHRDGRSGGRSRLKIVDWEFAGAGDAAWDVGAVFSNYLSFWLSSIPVSGEEPPDRFLELARYPLERMQTAMRAYWQAYVRGRGFDAGQSRAVLLRATKYAGARLVQTAFEQMQHSTFLTGNVVCLLQLSSNVMQRPHEAMVHLLGIPISA